MPTWCACGCRGRVSHAGNFRRECAPPGGRDPHGKSKAIYKIRNPIKNPIKNPINNPIKTNKRKDTRRELAITWANAIGRTGVLGMAACRRIADETAKDRTLFNDNDDSRLHGKSLDDLFADPTFACYIGETKRSLKEEAYAFLSLRGSTPVIAWAEVNKHGQPKTITMTQAKSQLDFGAAWLWKNEEQGNTTNVEDLLQQRYWDYDRPRRLYKACGAGANGYPDDHQQHFGNADTCLELHKVYITYSFGVIAAIDDGTVEEL